MDLLNLGKNGINVNAAIEILGDEEIYEETLRDFLEEMEDRLVKIEDYYQNEDLENYAILVHALKSDSKYLGFDKLADMALEHQLKSQEGDLEFVKVNYLELIEEVKRIIGVVENNL